MNAPRVPLRLLLVGLAVLLAIPACTAEPAITPAGPTELPPEHTTAIPTAPDPAPIGVSTALMPTRLAADLTPGRALADPALLQPANLAYLGAFRLPLPAGSSSSSWEYSGQALAYFPAGDPAGAADGFPGSLFGTGNDQQLLVSEISIPAPVISKNLAELNTATTLQAFTDITGGLFNLASMDLPIADLAYLPPLNGSGAGRLHFVFGQHFQEFEPSHGWHSLDLSRLEAAGPWILDGYTNYVTSDYLFEIPADWSRTVLPGQRLATGRFREGIWGGCGPALFAYNPGDELNPPAAGAAITEVTPLLLYGAQEPGLPDILTAADRCLSDYQAADHWSGGAWLSASDKSAVVLLGTKALGNAWYGFANGVVWDYDCADHTPPTCPEVPAWPNENRGYWAQDYQAQLIFFSPADLAAVARGERQTWEIQPYATLILDETLFDPQINPGSYKRDLVGAIAFDREHGWLYLMELLADGSQPLIHVWAVTE